MSVTATVAVNKNEDKNKMGPFTGKGKRVTGSSQGGRPPKFTPGEYYVRVVKGVYRESEMGHGTYAGIETEVVSATRTFSAAENAPYEASRRPGQLVSWVFNLWIHNKTRRAMADGNLANMAEALMDTVGFMDCLTTSEAEELASLLDAAESGDDSADPMGYICNLMVQDGGEKFAGLPIRITARDGRGRGAQYLFCACTCSPVSAEELEEHYPSRSTAA